MNSFYNDCVQNLVKYNKCIKWWFKIGIFCINLVMNGDCFFFVVLIVFLDYQYRGKYIEKVFLFFYNIGTF